MFNTYSPRQCFVLEQILFLPALNDLSHYICETVRLHRRCVTSDDSVISTLKRSIFFEKQIIAPLLTAKTNSLQIIGRVLP